MGGPTVEPWFGVLVWMCERRVALGFVAYDVADFSGTTGEDECDRAAVTVFELVDGGTDTAAELPALDGGEGSGGAGEEGDGGGELHCCGFVGFVG